MVERPDYFIFVLNASGSATAFRAALDQDDLAGLKPNLLRILRSRGPLVFRAISDGLKPRAGLEAVQ